MVSRLGQLNQDKLWQLQILSLVEILVALLFLPRTFESQSGT